MFDLRYHVASLAAVFVALIVGILVGVALADEAPVNEVELIGLRRDVNRLEGQLDTALQRSLSLERQQEGAQRYIELAHPALIADRLAGKMTALVFVGPVDARLQRHVEQTLDEAGAPAPTRMRALKVPIDADAMIATANAQSPETNYDGQGGLEKLGYDLGVELVVGGDTPLWDSLTVAFVQEQEGGSRRPVDGVVLTRTAEPQEGETAVLLRGFYRGLVSTGRPVVGVGISREDEAVEPFHRVNGLSTVDDVDLAPGRLALAVVLAGGDGGRYGLAPSAEDGILPPVEPVADEPVG